MRDRHRGRECEKLSLTTGMRDRHAQRNGLELRYVIAGSQNKEIELEFRLNEDTCSDVAEELVEAFDSDFPELDSSSICNTIERAILAADAECICPQGKGRVYGGGQGQAMSWEEEEDTCTVTAAVKTAAVPLSEEHIRLWKRLDQLVIQQEQELRQLQEVFLDG